MDNDIENNNNLSSIEDIIDMVDIAGIEALTPEEEEIYNTEVGEVESIKEDDGHYSNLASKMTDGELARLAQQVEDWFDDDIQSRKQWESREAKGVKILGVSDETVGGADFPGASRVVHPLLIEAITQFHSRAIAEMWPAEGPVKTVVLGMPTDETNAQAERVNDYMNYLYLNEMPGAFDEEDKMLFRLPLSGSCFKKTFYCPLEGTFISRMIEPTDFVVPYSASDLRTTPRFTHRFYEYINDVKKKVYGKYYRDYTVTVMGQTPDYRENEMKDAIDHTEGREDNEDDDQPHTMYEMYVDLELKIDPDVDQQTGQPTGIARPYIVTIDKDEQTVLRIQRNWKPDDIIRKRKKICVAHYKFNPGFGFYGFGLLHLIGGLTASATGALRALLDAAHFSNMQGGFRSRDARLPGGDNPVKPGEWREINADVDDLRKAFFPIPYKEPSKTLFELLGYLDERGQRFASTTENMVGDASNTAPVGTTLALIEQGSKVFTAIHKRLHISHAQEFKILHDLNYEYLPDEGYPYQLAGADNRIMASDFDGRVDVIPVSDPAIISNTQRITQSQAVLDLADKFPDIVNRRVAVERMLKAIRITDVDELMLPEQEGPNAEEQGQELENEKTGAEIDKIKSETVNKDIESTFSSVQSAASIAMQPELVPIADSILQSSGFEDKNEAPVASVAPMQLPGNEEPLPVEEMPLPEGVNMNTSPQQPPVTGNPTQGIETIDTEDNV